MSCRVDLLKLERRGLIALPPPPRPPPRAAPADWALEEFGGCALPDARLQTRLFSLARDFYARPTGNLAHACADRAKTKAAYRLLDHQHTTMQTLLKPHYQATQARVGRKSIILAVQDTSSVSYTTQVATEGPGPIGSGIDGPQGLHRTLKSGCRIEQRQLRDADRIEACLAIDLDVAWRIYYLTMLGRDVPQHPAPSISRRRSGKR